MRLQKLGFVAIVLLAVASASTVVGQPAATCEQACSKYKTCVIDIWAKNGRTMTADQKNTLQPGCMKTCNSAKFKGPTLACYKQAVAAGANSCQTYATCISSVKVK